MARRSSSDRSGSSPPKMSPKRPWPCRSRTASSAGALARKRLTWAPAWPRVAERSEMDQLNLSSGQAQSMLSMVSHIWTTSGMVSRVTSRATTRSVRQVDVVVVSQRVERQGHPCAPDAPRASLRPSTPPRVRDPRPTGRLQQQIRQVAPLHHLRRLRPVRRSPLRYGIVGSASMSGHAVSEQQRGTNGLIRQGVPLGTWGARHSLRASGRWNGAMRIPGSTCGVARERATGIEPTFSAWEALEGVSGDLQKRTNSQLNPFHI